MVLDRGRCVTMLTVSWLHALENLSQLVSHLPKLVVNLLAEGLVFLFKAANLLFEPIKARYESPWRRNPCQPHCQRTQHHLLSLSLCPCLSVGLGRKLA